MGMSNVIVQKPDFEYSSSCSVMAGNGSSEVGFYLAAHALADTLSCRPPMHDSVFHELVKQGKPENHELLVHRNVSLVYHFHHGSSRDM